jgi:CelD/BcsL family acetyltransferase involved in cellulose biosynthesis
VKAADLWSVPHPSLDAAAFPAASRRRATTLCLPVHQELRPEDLERIADVAGRRRPPAEPRLEEVPTIQDAREEWAALARGSKNIFSTPEWAETWWRHFGRDRALRLTACVGLNGELEALLPLYLASSKPVRTVRFLGHGPADQLGPVCDPARQLLAARALRQVVSEGRGLDLFIGDHMQGVEGWSALLGGSTLARESSPVLQIDALDWEGYLKSRRPSLRKEARSKQRRLERDHDLGFRLCEDPERLDADLDLFFSLHYARWGADSDAFVEGRERFHRDFAALALARGWLRLWFLEIDGRPVAASYGFRFEGAESHYQSGRDPDWEDASVGFVLLVHTLRLAIEDGLDEYRFLRGDHAYKMRFANHDPGLETVGVPRGPAGVASVLGARAARALPPELRSRLVRLGG